MSLAVPARIVAAGLLALPSSGAAWSEAPPRVWVEAELDRPRVPVNAQATLVVRFGQAIDVRALRFEVEGGRLTEVHPLPSPPDRELARGGMRYRVSERAYAILPFASGAAEFRVSVRGTTPAAISEARQGELRVAAKPVTLAVLPATPGAPWFPAHALRLAWSGDPGAVEAEGIDPLRRRVTIEAEGVDGSSIPPLAWPESPAYRLQHETPEVGRRIEGRRVVGWRTEQVRLHPQRAGPLALLGPSVAWWSVADAEWKRAALADLPVVAAATAGPSTRPPEASGSAAAAGGAPGRWPYAVGAFAVLGIAFWLGANRLRQVGMAWARRREYLAATRSGDAAATRRALLALTGLPNLEQCRARAAARGESALAREIARLEAACYGRSAEGEPAWRSAVLEHAAGRLS